MEKLQTDAKVEKIVFKKIPCAHYSASTTIFVTKVKYFVKYTLSVSVLVNCLFNASNYLSFRILVFFL